MRDMNPLKERLAQGRSAIGAWILIPSGLSAEAVARSGFDFVCIDNQHGANDYQSTAHMLQVVALGASVPLVRVPWNEPGVIGKMLDAGAHGIVVPMVNSVDEAQAAVRACRYAPEGARSYGPVSAGMRTEDYAASANEMIACIPMIESAEAIEAIDDILGVPGVDAIYVGPSDLAISLGLRPGFDSDSPCLLEALEAIVAGCRRHGIPAGIHGTTALVDRYLDLGFQMITVTSDLVAMRTGLADAAALVGGGTSATASAPDQSRAPSSG